MKILLLGKNGQVGRALFNKLSPLGELVALGRQEANLENLTNLQSILQTHQPEIIVNAAAYTAVDKAENDAASAYAINAKAVEVMGNFARLNDSLLVHYSTDYVFDGTNPAPYVETDEPRPLNVYGQSKLAGEKAVLDSGCRTLLFRTSWVFSEHGCNFIKTMLKLAQDRRKLTIINDQFGAPTSAELIATVTASAIQASEKPGIYHLSASGETSWHHFALRIIERALAKGTPLMLQPQEIEAIPAKDYPLPAMRPTSSRLNTHKLRQTFAVDLPDWTIDVDQTVDKLTAKERVSI